jgi:hypothetical protein
LAERKQPHPIRAEDRHIIISDRTVDNWIPFTFHDLNKKCVSDTAGKKQDTNGHRTAAMLNIYDEKPAIMKAAGEK